MPSDLIRTLVRVSQILEDLEIPYLTGGSLASSIFGVPRATQDIDLVIDLPPEKTSDLVRTMQPEFYVDRDTVTSAVQRRSSFNAIHFATAQKIDFFVRNQSAYAAEGMRRRRKVAFDEAGQCQVFIASPEDIILQKLMWFKMGSGVSERQWKDVLGVIKVQGDRLDRDYLIHWAKELAVIDLLEEALGNAG